MKNLFRFVVLTAFASTFILFGSCSTGTDGMDESYEAERRQVLENVGNNIIIPSYNALQNAVDDLQNEVATFSNDPSESNLAALQNQLKTARLAWQDANLFQFGPAEPVVLRTSLNTYPADTAQIESNIESGDYTLGTIANRAAVGFPALDYLLHGLGSTNQEITSMYTDGANASNRIAYLQDNVLFIKEKVDAVVEAWSSSGDDYIGTFLSDDKAGTDVGSSLGELVNAMVNHYEKFIRSGKIGIPSGTSSAGVPLPARTEAFYAGYSAELAVANVRAVKRLFLGNGLEGTAGTGLDDNLISLNGLVPEVDTRALVNEIETELDEAIAALEGLNDPLSQQIEENNEPVLSAFEELQDVVVLLKADMTSVLGITITYQDNDGD